MKASRVIGYYIVFSSQGSAIFWLFHQKIVDSTLWAWMGLMKRAWNRREGEGHNFWKNDIAQGDNINWLKSNTSKMADKWVSVKPWSSICKLNDIPRGSMTVPRLYQKTKKWLVPQLLEWSSNSLSYEMTQPIKTNCTTFHGHHSHLLWWPTLWSAFLPESEQIHFLPMAVSLLNSFNNEKTRNWDSLGPETRHHGFWLGLSPCHIVSCPNLR